MIKWDLFLGQGWLNICKSINMTHHINEKKEKNHMILTIDAEKAYDKIQLPFLIKILKKVGIEGISQRPYMKDPQLIFSMGKIESFPPKVRSMTVMSTLTTVVQVGVGSPSLSNQTTERIKGIQISKEKVKHPFFADNIILYMKNPKVSAKKLLELKHKARKVAGYKISCISFF